MEAYPTVIPAPLRTQVRDAIARAWDTAIAAGALPPLPDGIDPPTVEVEHPANPDHGDVATNLAMKLARPYRMAPLAIATVLAAKLVRDASAAGSRSPIEAAARSIPTVVRFSPNVPGSTSRLSWAAHHARSSAA